MFSIIDANYQAAVQQVTSSKVKSSFMYGSTPEKLFLDLHATKMPNKNEGDSDLDVDFEKWSDAFLSHDTGDSLPCGKRDRDDEVSSESARKAKRSRNESEHVSCDDEESGRLSNNSANDLPMIVDDSLQLGVPVTKKMPGRSADPRMNRAVMAKVANPGLPLYEALVMGGFKFPHKAKMFMADYKVFDESNVSLKQRKNQLNRRLRQTKNKTGKVMLSGDAAKIDTAPLKLKGSVSSAADTNKFEGCATSTKVAGKKSNQERRDSFYDMIIELPGIEDLPCDV